MYLKLLVTLILPEWKSLGEALNHIWRASPTSLVNCLPLLEASFLTTQSLSPLIRAAQDSHSPKNLAGGLSQAPVWKHMAHFSASLVNRLTSPELHHLPSELLRTLAGGVYDLSHALGLIVLYLYQHKARGIGYSIRSVFHA
ncbi:hypothetical protein C8J57DRAFT_1232933 [Mycena rebaudengoi]|nr:hypothetical protein C8J57DRAFT_1232933 [Mycena rebaudengoi]